MYNRYLSTADDVPCYSTDNMQNIHTHTEEKTEKNLSNDTVTGLFNNITSLFSGKGQKTQFSLDNIVMLAIIYFLIADSDEIDTELLIIVGILLFLGI